MRTYCLCSLISVEDAKMCKGLYGVILGLLWMTVWSQLPGYEPVTIDGSFWRCDLNQPEVKLAIYNRTNEKIYGFIISITEIDGSPYNGLLILGQTDPDNEHDPDFDIDDNMDGTNEDPEEANLRTAWNVLSSSDNTDYSPETTMRTQTNLGDTLNDQNHTPMDALLPNNTDPLEISIILSGTPPRTGCYIFQPQDRHLNVIAGRIEATFETQNTYFVRLSSEMVWRAPIQGIAFSDLNASGTSITHLYLRGVGFTILNAVQKNSEGDLIAGGNYDPQTGRFELPVPVGPNEPFYLAITPNTLWGSTFMTIRASLWAIPVGDVDGNGCVDDGDLLSVLFAFGSDCINTPCAEDMDGNGVVDDSDLLTVLFHFGEGC